MRSLFHPVGHLSPGVYWVRRALLLVLAIVLLVVLFRVTSGGGGQKPSADSVPTTTPTPTPADAVTQTPSVTPSASTTPSTPSTAPKRQDDGRCTGATTRVSVAPVARRVSAGRPLNVHVSLSTSRADGCAATVDADRLVVTVTSGKDRIWTSAHCVKAISRATLALAAGKPSTTTVTWDGRRSVSHCPANQTVARPGTYVVKAVYAGNPSAEQAFQVV